jgi:hypothetical protein
MYDRKQTFMSITSIHREITQTMKLNQSFLLLIQMSVHGCSSYNSLYALLSWIDNVTQYNEGVYIRFPSWTLKLSNLKLNSYLPALTKLNAIYLLKDESHLLKVQYNIQVRHFLNDSFKICATVPKHFQNLCWLVQLFPLDVLARLMSWRCSCIILPGLKNFMGSCP